MEHDIDLIVKLIKKRKPEALNRAMELYIGNVYHIAKSILYRIADAEDIEECVQDTFLDAWNNIDKYNPERGSFKTWLMILCKYNALNKKKVLMKEPEFISLEEDISSINNSPENDFLIKEGTSQIIKAINTLGLKDREIFIRRYLLNQNIDEICSIMNLTRKAIDNRLCRGRKQLKEKLSSMERRNSNA